MGAYIYKVGMKPVGEHEGRPVYLATYAYKPYWYASEQKENERMAFQSGARRAEAFWRKKRDAESTNVLVVSYAEKYGPGAVYNLVNCEGSFVDETRDGFDQKPVLTEQDLSVGPPKWYVTLQKRAAREKAKHVR
jgi:hypothetical protein